jgi:hypothetical protein
MRGLVPERVYPSAEQSQSPCAEGQTATMLEAVLEAVLAVLDVSCVVVLASVEEWGGGVRKESVPRLQHLPNHDDVQVRRRARLLAYTRST